MIHEIPLERRTLHGHFSRELTPILTVDSGDTIAVACLDAGWNVAPGEKFEPFDEELDAGHALIGPIEIRGARKGQTLAIQIESVRVGNFGFTVAGGWSTWLNDRIGMGPEAGEHLVRWSLDPDAGVAREDQDRELDLDPFLGVLGMPPDEPGTHGTGPPRQCGGNIDCKELRAATTLFLPISVDGAYFSAGDGHGRQGDGEASGTAIECPLDRTELTLTVRDDLELEWPVAWTPGAWVTFGFDEDLDEAAAIAVGGMLDLMGRELGLGRGDALAFASLVVDVRVTQLVNGVLGAHAVLPHDAIRTT
ncbi:acetamidase/formamidase family protein [soil metagenome]